MNWFFKFIFIVFDSELWIKLRETLSYYYIATILACLILSVNSENNVALYIGSNSLASASFILLFRYKLLPNLFDKIIFKIAVFCIDAYLEYCDLSDSIRYYTGKFKLWGTQQLAKILFLIIVLLLLIIGLLLLEREINPKNCYCSRVEQIGQDLSQSRGITSSRDTKSAANINHSSETDTLVIDSTEISNVSTNRQAHTTQNTQESNDEQYIILAREIEGEMYWNINIRDSSLLLSNYQNTLIQTKMDRPTVIYRCPQSGRHRFSECNLFELIEAGQQIQITTLTGVYENGQMLYYGKIEL